MIIDARAELEKQDLTSDVCIVGSGAAGIPLALELAEVGLDVVVIEAGGRNASDTRPDFFYGQVEDLETHRELHLGRRVGLGGTTTLWPGRCMPFDDIDFRVRDYVPHSGWPIQRDDLVPYYERAHGLCQMGAFAYEAKEVFGSSAPPARPGLADDVVTTTGLERWMPRTDFSETFGRDLAKAGNIRLVLNAVCTGISTSPSGDKVDSLSVSLDGQDQVSITAKVFVLCAGGLENTRLLLAANDVHPKGLGNQGDALGRFYMKHLTGEIADIRFDGPPDQFLLDYRLSSEGLYLRRRIGISERSQRDRGLLNFSAFLRHPALSDPCHGSALLSLMYYKQELRTALTGKHSGYYNRMRPSGQTSHLGRHLAHLGNVLTGGKEILTVGPTAIRGKFQSSPKVPSLMFRNRAHLYSLSFHVEQEPNPDSTVALSTERDQFGLPRLTVDFRCTKRDLESLYEAHDLIAETLDTHRCGRLIYRPEIEIGYRKEIRNSDGHFLGTTRMAKSPTQGVVDENCRVHDLRNLFVSGGSVFPTCGHANPTLTVIALSIRLADRIKGVAAGL